MSIGAGYIPGISGGPGVPSERRQLLFQPAEAVEAIREYNRRLGKPFPVGAVAASGPEDGAGGTIRFRITIAVETADARGQTTAEAPRQDIVTEDSALVAALILYCRDRRIPIAAAAEKGLLRSGTQTCLLLTINAK